MVLIVYNSRCFRTMMRGCSQMRVKMKLYNSSPLLTKSIES